MKKAILILLVLGLCLCLCACGKYAKYDDLIGYIEAGDEENAINEVLVLLEQNKPETTEPEITEPATITVELTMDNWQEYFEIRSCEEKHYNAFGELEETRRGDAICLKERYLSSLTTGGAEVAFKVTATIEHWEYDEENNIFVENGTVCESLNYEEERVLSTMDLRSQSNTDTYVSDGNGQVVAVVYYGHIVCVDKSYRPVFTGINVINVTGTLEFYE